MDEVIRIDKYTADIYEGQIRIFAVKGKKKYIMPKCHETLCDMKHLAIKLVPHDEYTDSLFSLNPGEEYYIPMRTAL